MTQFSLAARNLLVLDPAIRALIGKSKTWPTGWVFDTKPLGITLENSSKVMIVIAEESPWDRMNSHNTMLFPRLFVDIWADPSRLPDDSVATWDADDKIEALIPLLDRHFHTTNLDVSPYQNVIYGKPGEPRIWGTAEQIENRTGQIILGSERAQGPDYSDVRDGNGARMARLIYNVSKI